MKKLNGKKKESKIRVKKVTSKHSSKKEKKKPYFSVLNLFKQITPFHFVLFICAIIVISHTLYVLKTFAYPEWDEHKYLGAAIHFLPVLQHPTIHFFQKMLQVQREWLPSAPALYPWVIDVPLLIFGTFFTYKIAMWINVIFYIATILGVYFLGKEFFSRRVSAVVAFIFAFYGFPLFYLHFVYTETAGTAFTILSLYFLTKVDNFQSRRNAFLFGVFAAFAVLTRWTTPLFIIGPLTVVLWKMIKDFRLIDKKHVVRNIGIFLALCLLPLVIYYIPNKDGFFAYVKTASVQAPSWVSTNLRNPFSGHSFIWYLSIIAQQTIWFYLLFLIGFFLAVVYFKKYAFLLGAFIIPFIFFTYISIFKDDRFIVPLYPTIALLSGIIFDFIEKKNWEISWRILLIITVLIGTLNFLGTSWGIGPMKFSTTGSLQTFTLPNSILLPMPIGHPRRVWLAPVSWPPRPDEGKGDVIIDSILNDWHKKQPPHVLLTFENSQVGGGINKVIAYERFNILNTYNLDGISKDDYRMFFDRLNTADYMIVKDGIFDKGFKEGESSDWDNFIRFVRIFNRLYQYNNRILPNAFVSLKTIHIPSDNSTLIIYKKQKQITSDEWIGLGETLKQEFPNSSVSIDNAVEQYLK